MRTVAATRQDLNRADLESAPKTLDWARCIRDSKIKLSKSARSLSLLLITLGQGQHISMSKEHMAEATGMRGDTVGNALDELARHGLITAKGKGRNNTTLYRLTVPKGQVVTPVQEEPVTPVGEQVVAPVGEQPVTPPEEDNIEDLDQERDESATSTCAPRSDDVGEAKTKTKTKTRAGDDEELLEYIGDLEGCVDELAARLRMHPGKIGITVLARKLRALGIKHDEPMRMSGVLARWTDKDIWRKYAEAGSPVGYMLDDFDRFLSQYDLEDPEPEPEVPDERDFFLDRQGYAKALVSYYSRVSGLTEEEILAKIRDQDASMAEGIRMLQEWTTPATSAPTASN
jgi:DNA-binding transcriptional ArsR family regulator